MPCQEHLSQLRQLDTAWQRERVAIVVVTFEAGFAATYARTAALPWPVLIDQERQLYRAYGMDRASLRAVWSWSSMVAYVRLVRAGKKLQRATGDTRQRGGDVLIDPDQRVRLHHVGVGPADRPAPEAILAAIRRGTAGDSRDTGS